MAPWVPSKVTPAGSKSCAHVADHTPITWLIVHWSRASHALITWLHIGKAWLRPQKASQSWVHSVRQVGRLVGGVVGCSGQWPVIRRSWWLEAVSVAQRWDIRWMGLDLLWWRMGSCWVLPHWVVTWWKQEGRCHKGSDLSFLFLLHFPELPCLVTFSSGFLNCKLTTKPPQGRWQTPKWSNILQ